MMGRADEIELGGNWRDGVVLKRDVFSTIERGHFRTADGDVDAVARRLDEVPWWSVPLALFLFRRERRALAIAGPLGMAPPLLFAGRRVLVRGWLNGVPLHIAKPFGDTGYFRSAKTALRALHRAGITHNDLAKEQNWLYDDGRAYVTDFQLAVVLSPPRRAVPPGALRGPAPSAQAQAPLRSRRADRRRAPRARP